jgi:hypothetical protein
MAKPILSRITSIHALTKGQPWAYQPTITGGGPVAAWTCTGLPPGLAINASTGLISGVPTTPGVSVCKLRARDSASVFSDQLIFPMGVESVPGAEGGGAVRINVNLQTAQVYAPDGGDLAPLFARYRDKILVAIGFEDNGVLQDIEALGLLNVTLKVWDDEPEILLTDGLYIKSGDYDTARYLVTLNFDQPAIQQAFDEFESRNGTGFVGLGEILWVWFTARQGWVEPQQHERSSRNFSLSTFRDLDSTRRVITQE